MLSKEQMIEAIYEKIADKNLSFGCKMIEGGTTYIFLYKKQLDSGKKNEYNIYLNQITNLEYTKSFIDVIIGHPVMIGDVLDWFNTIGINAAVGANGKIIGNKNKEGSYFEIDFDLRKPIEEQSDDCIIYVYNLIK